MKYLCTRKCIEHYKEYIKYERNSVFPDTIKFRYYKLIDIYKSDNATQLNSHASTLNAMCNQT